MLEAHLVPELGLDKLLRIRSRESEPLMELCWSLTIHSRSKVLMDSRSAEAKTSKEWEMYCGKTYESSGSNGRI